jgi:hypothetical protein
MSHFYKLDFERQLLFQRLLKIWFVEMEKYRQLGHASHPPLQIINVVVTTPTNVTRIDFATPELARVEGRFSCFEWACSHRYQPQLGTWSVWHVNEGRTHPHVFLDRVVPYLTRTLSRGWSRHFRSPSNQHHDKDYPIPSSQSLEPNGTLVSLVRRCEDIFIFLERWQKLCWFFIIDG